MIIKKLKLKKFRNYAKAEIIFNEKMNLITGKNAQGKTNLLESLVYLSLTRSHRISDDKKLIKDGMSIR
jgi:DNA replication and repair protein RecF